MIETLEDIIEELANSLGIYGCCEHECDSCSCRKCWTSAMRHRIELAVDVECRLTRITGPCTEDEAISGDPK